MDELKLAFEALTDAQRDTLVCFQLFIGISLFLASSYLGHKAYSDDIFGNPDDRAFSCYVLSSLLLFCIGGMLLFNMGIAFIL